MLAALVLALLVAFGLGMLAFVSSRPGAMAEIFRETARRNPETAAVATPEFLFFSIFAFLYLMWATLPLSIGSSKQFEAGKLLIYPISLRKLFALDFLSEVTTLQSIFAIPTIVAICIGAGLGSGKLAVCLFAAIPIILFGISLSKWLGTSIGSLVRRKRARGETIIALVGAIAGLGGALIGQIAPLIFQHAEAFRSLRWTPPGAAASLIASRNAGHPLSYAVDLGILTLYIIVLIIATYWIARRAALGLGGSKRRREATIAPATAYSGWEIPFLPSDLSAIVEKELRYVMRNAQVRMLALMPLVLVIIRLFQSQRWSARGISRTDTHEFFTYGSALLASGGVLYVFLLLAGLSCNQFAFEEGGMRSLILSPIDRKHILMGKNLALTMVAFVFSTVLLTINTIVFQDLTAPTLLFVLLSFISYAAIISTFGNWMSIRFPKRMEFGKRMNVSGVAGLLFLPMLVLLAVPPVLSVLAGYSTSNLLIEFLTLTGFCFVTTAIYFLTIGFQGKTLARREIEILDAVREPVE
jgi:hypothetical protein